MAYDIYEEAFEISKEILKLHNYLVKVKREYRISDQIKRSTTSVSANITEANNAESPKDFIHKLSISVKECAESIHWLDLLFEDELIEEEFHLRIKKRMRELYYKMKRSIYTCRKNNPSINIKQSRR